MDHDLINEIDFSNKQEIVSKFSKLTKSLIGQYERYNQFEEFDSINEEIDNQKLHSNDYELIDDPNSNSNSSKTNLLDLFLKKFNQLTEFISKFKRENSIVFISVFQKSNVILIQLVEFLSKLLNILDFRNSDDSGFNISNDFSNFVYYKNFSDLKKGFESKLTIIGKTIQFLHVLLTSKMFNHCSFEVNNLIYKPNFPRSK